MPQRYFPDWISAYLDYSGHSEAPDRFHFWTAVSVIAGALRRRVWIDMGYFDWTPNFYIIFVGPPGIISKSTTADIGMRLLHQVPDISFGPDCITWQALVQSLSKAKESMEMEEGAIFTSPLTIVSSEFGNLLNPQDRDMVDLLVSLWDSRIGTFQKTTKTMGDDVIENPWLNILACTTPAWISGNFPDYMIGGGFTSRCIFIYGDKKRRFIAYPKRNMPKDNKETAKKLIHDLEDISVNIMGEYVLTEAAIEWGEAWYLEHYTKGLRNNLNNEQFAGYLARKQTHIHKLAMVLSASKSNKLVIEQEDLVTANTMVTYLEDDMPKVFSQIGKTPAARYAGLMTSVMKQAERLDRVDLYRKHFGMLQWKDFFEILNSNIEAGYLRQIRDGRDIYIEWIGGEE